MNKSVYVDTSKSVTMATLTLIKATMQSGVRCITADKQWILTQLHPSQGHQRNEQISGHPSLMVHQQIGKKPKKVIKTLIYGVKSSGNHAKRGLRKTAELSKNEYPHVNLTINNDVYVDDCLSGKDSM